jgi:hypothetical protein
MTIYYVQFYCNDEVVTTYCHTVSARGDTDCESAAQHVFGRMPTMPADIVGCVVIPTYLH